MGLSRRACTPSTSGLDALVSVVLGHQEDEVLQRLDAMVFEERRRPGVQQVSCGQAGGQARSSWRTSMRDALAMVHAVVSRTLQLWWLLSLDPSALSRGTQTSHGLAGQAPLPPLVAAVWRGGPPALGVTNPAQTRCLTICGGNKKGININYKKRKK